MDKEQAIDLSLRGLLQPELRADEEILWFAAPQRRPHLHFSPLVLLAALVVIFVSGYVFSSLYASFAGFSDATQWEVFSIITPFFLLLGAGVIFWRQLRSRLKLTIYIYAVTNHRIIISSHRDETEIRSFPLASIKVLKRVSGRRGLEHIIFAEENDFAPRFFGSPDRTFYRQARRTEVGFFNLAHAREVEQIILKAQEDLMGVGRGKAQSEASD